MLVGGRALGAAGASLETHRSPGTPCGRGGDRAKLCQELGAKSSVGAWADHPVVLPWGCQGHACRCGGGGGPVWLSRAGAGCSGRGWTTLCHCPTAQPPATPKRPQTTVAWGQPRGDPCAGRNSLAPFSRPPCRGCLGTPAGAGTGLEEGSGPALLGGLLHGMAARPCSRVAPLGDGGPAGIVPAGHCGPGAQTAPISPQLPRRAQTGGSRKSP